MQQKVNTTKSEYSKSVFEDIFEADRWQFNNFKTGIPCSEYDLLNFITL